MNSTRTHIIGVALAGVLALSILPARADTFGTGVNSFTIDFVTVGDPGNSDDSGTTGSYFTPYGGVAYTYRMGTYEISRDMITKSNAEGTLGLTLADMNTHGGNIVTRPATGISWNEAARFVNWLNTSQNYVPAYKFSLQPGDGGYTGNENLVPWTSNDAGFNASNPYRNGNAKYFLPSEDEWYKAAYYSGSGSTYFDYATGSDTVPTAVGGGTAVYAQSSSAGPADITQAGGVSHYGTMGQNGNAYEWNESAYDGENDSASENRGMRGSYYRYPTEFNLDSHYRLSPGLDPTFASDVTGFRVASVPEPSSALMLFGAGVMLTLRRRRNAV